MTPAPTKILLAEDDRLIAKAAGAALKRHGFEVISAADGEEAFDKAKLEKPDLILLDVIMPKVDGLIALTKLKADPETAAIPVIMLSNLGQAHDVESALRMGAVAYYLKNDLRGDALAAKIGEALQMFGRPA